MINLNTDRYSPWDLLPVPEPCTVSPPDGYFYNHVARHLIPDFIRIMNNGIPIDIDKVRELDDTLVEVLAEVDRKLQNNKLMLQFQQLQHMEAQQTYIAEQRSKLKLPKHFLKPFKDSDIIHRSYLVNYIIDTFNLTVEVPSDTLPNGKPRWTANDVKRIRHEHPTFELLVLKQLTPTNQHVKAAMLQLATDKAIIHNRQYNTNIDNASALSCEPFNVNSPQQKARLFDFLGIDSEKASKDTGAPSWDRDQIERVNKETADPDIKELTQAMIDASYGGIVKNNFVKAFYRCTYNGNLHGSLKLFGAKSFRPTSSDPNLLNMPSTKSIYSKPVKRCFVAPPGYVVLTADYSALEDRVIACLTRDINKCNIFKQNLDGHCLNAYGYFKDEVAKYMTITGDVVADVRKFFELCESGHKELKEIRQKGKPATSNGVLAQRCA